MKLFPKASCLLAGLAIAIAAPNAIAAQNDAKATKEPMSTAQKNALGKSMALKNRNFQSPRTMAQGKATLVRMPDGSLSAQVPTELWNHLSVQKDAQGNLHQVESSDYVAPNSTWEGLDNE